MTNNLTIECTYSCEVCGLDDVPVKVPARGEEDVVDWMRKVCTPALYRDHHFRCPECTSQMLKNLMIPMPVGTDRIGGAVAN